MLSMVKSGEILQDVKMVMLVSIATQELSNSFIQKFTNQPSVMICRPTVIVQEDPFVHLLTEILKWLENQDNFR
jgi:hypothetical protein